MLINCVVTTQPICGFVFAYAKSRLSHDAAQIVHVALRIFTKNAYFEAFYFQFADKNHMSFYAV